MASMTTQRASQEPSRLRRGWSPARTPSSRNSFLIAGHEKVPGILRVDSAGAVDGRRGVGCAERKLLENSRHADRSLRNLEKIAVFAVGVQRSVRIDDETVDAPFEAVRMIADAGDVSIRIPRAAQG